MPSRESWLQARKGGIGGSDAAAVLGLSPWKTNVALWEEKTGRREDADLSDLEYVQYGIDSEPHLRALFGLDHPQYRIEHEENVVVQHPEHPQLRASLDGKLIDEDGRVGVLELKTVLVHSGAERKKWQGQIPQHYYVQLLHYMLVTQAEYGILKARLRSQWDGSIRIVENHYHFERQDVEADLAYLLQNELRFWKYVETDTRPDLILPEI